MLLAHSLTMKMIYTSGSIVVAPILVETAAVTNIENARAIRLQFGMSVICGEMLGTCGDSNSGHGKDQGGGKEQVLHHESS